MKTQAQLEENRKIMRHGEQMRLAREMHNTHRICPDCFAPPTKCKCPHPYDRRTSA